jgi:hypothetical protein
MITESSTMKGGVEKAYEASFVTKSRHKTICGLLTKHIPFANYHHRDVDRSEVRRLMIAEHSPVEPAFFSGHGKVT